MQNNNRQTRTTTQLTKPHVLHNGRSPDKQQTPLTVCTLYLNQMPYTQERSQWHTTAQICSS